MSVKLSSYVWDGCAHAGLKLTSVAIMARLADFSNDEGICWPSILTIARQIGAGESTVRTAIKQLEKEGWLTSEKRRKGNRNASNIYQLNVVKLYQAAKKGLFQPTKSDVSKSDASESDPSKFVASNSVPSKSSKKVVFDPSAPEGDPSVTSKYDPSINHSLSQNSGESSDQPKNDFLTRYPEAVIYSANGQKWGDEGDLKTAKWMFGRVKKLNPSALEPTWYDWANDIRLMRQIDGRTHEQICALFDWANKDSFWHKNILSPRKLRKHFDELTVRSQELRNEPKVQVDTVERDSAFSRLIGSRSKPKNRIEEIALELAGKTGIRRMSEFSGRQAWNSIWKQAIEMLQEAQ